MREPRSSGSIIARGPAPYGWKEQVSRDESEKVEKQEGVGCEGKHARRCERKSGGRVKQDRVLRSRKGIISPARWQKFSLLVLLASLLRAALAPAHCHFSRFLTFSLFHPPTMRPARPLHDVLIARFPSPDLCRAHLSEPFVPSRARPCPVTAECAQTLRPDASRRLCGCRN